jgi:hypothetical protein
MTTATQDQNSLRAICVDRESGRIVRDIEVFFLRAHEPITQETLSFLRRHAVIEPGRLYVSYGTYGNACIATDTGAVVWKTQEHIFGHDNNVPAVPDSV